MTLKTIKVVIGIFCSIVMLQILGLWLERTVVWYFPYTGFYDWYGSAGTGFFIDKGGTIVTAGHVVHGCGEVTVIDRHGVMTPATIAAEGTNDILDMAVLKTGRPSPAFLSFAELGLPKFDEEVPHVETSFFSIVGFPGGLEGFIPRRDPVSKAELQRGWHDRSVDHWLFDLRGRFEHGNSGGPLLNAKGQVLGIMIKIHGEPLRSVDGELAWQKGNAVYGGYIVDWLRRLNIPITVAPPDAPPGPDAVASGAVVRVQCYDRHTEH